MAPAPFLLPHAHRKHLLLKDGRVQRTVPTPDPCNEGRWYRCAWLGCRRPSMNFRNFPAQEIRVQWGSDKGARWHTMAFGTKHMAWAWAWAWAWTELHFNGGWGEAVVRGSTLSRLRS